MTAAVIEAGDDLPLTIPALLRARTDAEPERVLLAVDDGVLTYGDASRRSAELARALLAAGIGPHSRVALLFPNGPEFVVSWLALARIGAVSVPLSTFSTSIELVGLLRGADVTLLLATPGYRSHDYVASLSAGMEALDLAAPPPLLAAAAPSLRRIVFAFDGAGGEDLDDGWTLDGLLATASSVRTDVLVAAELAVTPADPMVVVHTSGSTSNRRVSSTTTAR